MNKNKVARACSKSFTSRSISIFKNGKSMLPRLDDMNFQKILALH